ncbi:MAG: hypothetical protein IKR48_12380 [Kiritimatiellae bacterium]|nr:hypothetical protein [Kiritimatiellia bacterium]
MIDAITFDTSFPVPPTIPLPVNPQTDATNPQSANPSGIPSQEATLRFQQALATTPASDVDKAHVPLNVLSESIAFSAPSATPITPISQPIETVADIPPALLSDNSASTPHPLTTPQSATTLQPVTVLRNTPVTQAVQSNGETIVMPAPITTPDAPVSHPTATVADSPAPQSGNDMTVPQNTSATQAVQPNVETVVTPSPVTTPDAPVSQPVVAVADSPAPLSGNGVTVQQNVNVPHPATVPQNASATQAVQPNVETVVTPSPVTTPDASVSQPVAADADSPASQPGNDMTAQQNVDVSNPVTTQITTAQPTTSAPQTENVQQTVQSNDDTVVIPASTPSVIPSAQSVGEVAALPVSTPVVPVADSPAPQPRNDMTVQQNAAAPQFATQTVQQNMTEPQPATAPQTVTVQQPVQSNGETIVVPTPIAMPDTPVSQSIHVVADSPAPQPSNDMTVQQNATAPNPAMQTVPLDANMIQAVQSNGETIVPSAPIVMPDTPVSQPVHAVADSPAPQSSNDMTVQQNATIPQSVPQNANVMQAVQSNGETVVTAAPIAMPAPPVSQPIHAVADSPAPQPGNNMTVQQNATAPLPATALQTVIVQQPVQSNGETVVTATPIAMPDTSVSQSGEVSADVQAPRVASEASVKPPTIVPETSQVTPQGTRITTTPPMTKSGKIVSEVTTEIDAESVVLQAAPVSQSPQAIDVNPLLSAEAVQAATATAARARTLELVEAVEAVAETIRVSPGDLRGEGEVRIFLKSNVLDGSEIRLEAKSGTLSVAFHPATPDVAQLIEQNRAQLEMRLAERVHAFQISVSVKKGKTEHETV